MNLVAKPLRARDATYRDAKGRPMVVIWRSDTTPNKKQVPKLPATRPRSADLGTANATALPEPPPPLRSRLLRSKVAPQLVPPLGGLDPFDRLYSPAQGQPQMQMLVQYYLNVIVPASNLSELDWGYGFKVSTQYEAPFHMILHVAACHRNFLRGDFSAPENTSYMLKALQLVKNDISNTETQYSIGAIRGVCYLAMAECQGYNPYGKYSSWNNHMKGLSRMIELRGGMATLSLELQLKIYMADFLGCVETDTPARFPISPECPLYPTPAKGKPFPSKFDSLPLNSYLIPILHDLITLTTTLNNVYFANNKNYKHYKPSEFQIGSLKYRLLSHYPIGISEVVRIGALLFLRLTLFHFTEYKQPYPILLSNLQIYCELNPPTPNYPPKIGIWLAMLAAMLSVEITRREFWVRQVSVRAVGMDWEEVRQILKDFLWVEGMHDKPGRIVWDEVEKLMRENSQS